MAGVQISPVSPIEMTTPLPVPIQHTSPNVPVPLTKVRPSKATWLPFTLSAYFLCIPICLSLLLGAALVSLTVVSERDRGLGANDGSSGMLFGWRFTPTLIAVLYAQVTVILFEDVKRTEPFARLAAASSSGTSAYGTILQTPKAWWSIFYDLCFRRQRVGKTSWALICAALVNVVALLAISPLSSALLTSEEVWVEKSAPFIRMVPKENLKLPLIPTRETLFRTISAITRNASSSAWVGNTSITFPFWPSQERAQYGTRFESKYGAWKMETNTLSTSLECQDMKLESADLVNKQYSSYTRQGNGPYNGTQPMVVYVLTSNDGCRYELSNHPTVDLAITGGVSWSDASSRILTSNSLLPLAGRPFGANLTATSNYARLNTSSQCAGRDIIIASTAWTGPLEVKGPWNGFFAMNQTYTRSPDFRMRALLCDSRFKYSTDVMTATLAGTSHTLINGSTPNAGSLRAVSADLIDVSSFQNFTMQDEWKQYFDTFIQKETIQTADRQTAMLSNKVSAGFSGMAPLLGALSNYNITSMLTDPDLARKAELVKGRFFAETIKEVLNQPDFLKMETVDGIVTIVEERVVVLTEIGIALAVLFFLSTVILTVLLFTSRLGQRKLNLRSDPASTVGLTLLLNGRLGRSSTLRDMHDATRVDLYTQLQKQKYLTTEETLLRGDRDPANPLPVKSKSTWKPRIIQALILVVLGLFLTLVLAAILVLNAFSLRSQLSQTAFVYEADMSRFKLSFSTFAPISIAPTVISVITGLWWDQLDSSFRILQPFISMSRAPTPINRGAGLTYRSKTWLGAAIKAGRNRHWVLLMIAIGSVLAQVLTVSMSALFEKNTFNSSKQISMMQTLELRQVPVIMEVNVVVKGKQKQHAAKMVEDLYADPAKNWLYGASIQHAFAGSSLPWTSDSWNFLPVETYKTSQTAVGMKEQQSNITPTTANISIAVPAIRARLSCSRIEEAANISSWMTPVDLSDKESLLDEDLAILNATGGLKVYELPRTLFANTTSYTTVHATSMDLVCCGNGTIAKPGNAVIGYWSAMLPSDFDDNNTTFPFTDFAWPLNISTKWLVGKPIVLRSSNQKRDPNMYFREVPKVQAARCEPVIETAQATIAMDESSNVIHSYTVADIKKAGKTPWEDIFTSHMPRLNISGTSKLNMTTSYGILYLDSLLGSADRKEPGSSGFPKAEQLDDNAFVFRDPKNGMNMDLMTYSMYTLARKDPLALLNYTTLVAHADTVFSTFFQHFVSSGLSPTDGGYAYQPINDQSLNGLSEVVPGNKTWITARALSSEQNNRNITASLSQRIRVLQMNTIATYLSTAILMWLILTTLVVICLQRRYTSLMNRDVQLIADMLLLIAGSDNFLELVQQRGVSLKRDSDIKTMLGWFRDRRGAVRWGIEIVGGRNAVEWIDAPKQGFHVPVTTTKKRWTPW